MARYIKPRSLVVSGERRPYEVVPAPWYDVVIVTLLGVPFSVLDLARAAIGGVILVAVMAAFCAFVITAYFAS